MSKPPDHKFLARPKSLVNGRRVGDTGAMLRFTAPPRAGVFLRRYKRFFADVRVGADEMTAHVPNTGTLLTCLHPGRACVITETDDPKRKLRATLHLLETPGGWVGVNTSIPNRLVTEGWARVPGWAKYGVIKPEYKLNAETRLDLVLARTAADLAAGRDLHYVEIKNVTYADDGVARFPDAVTARGARHLRELMALTRLGHRAEIVFVVQRTDCVAFGPADAIDPGYGQLLREAARAGVRIRAFACAIDPLVGVELLHHELPIELTEP